MDLKLPTPDHTTLSRRSISLKPVLDYRACPGDPVHLIVDSTGLSIHGEARWSRYKYGAKRRRGWRKLHVAVDGTGNLLATSLSRETIQVASQLPDLFETYTGPLASLTGDRGYDQASVYREALGRNTNASVIIHPRINGTHSRRKLELKQRNEHLESIRSDKHLPLANGIGLLPPEHGRECFLQVQDNHRQEAESERGRGEICRGDSGVQYLESMSRAWTG